MGQFCSPGSQRAFHVCESVTLALALYCGYPSATVAGAGSFRLAAVVLFSGIKTAPPGLGLIRGSGESLRTELTTVWAMIVFRENPGNSVRLFCPAWVS